MQQQLVTSSLSDVETDSQSDVVDRVDGSSLSSLNDESSQDSDFIPEPWQETLPPPKYGRQRVERDHCVSWEKITFLYNFSKLVRLCMLVNINERVDCHRSNMVYSIPSDKSTTLPFLNETFFSQGKANYHWLNSDYPVIIMSTTRYAHVMLVEVFVTFRHANRDTYNCNLHK